MTEAEWLAGTDPQPMLEILRGGSSDRKQLLFAAASFRRLSSLLPDPRQHCGIHVLEALAAGNVPRSKMEAFVREYRPTILGVGAAVADIDEQEWIALMLYRAVLLTTPADDAYHALSDELDSAGTERRAQSALLRDIFGNPFRPVTFDPKWLMPNVAALASTIYNDRAFDRLPSLTDALMAAGCMNEEVLAHCRGPGPHARGCWVLDLLLGKS